MHCNDMYDKIIITKVLLHTNTNWYVCRPLVIFLTNDRFLSD